MGRLLFERPFSAGASAGVPIDPIWLEQTRGVRDFSFGTLGEYLFEFLFVFNRNVKALARETRNADFPNKHSYRGENAMYTGEIAKSANNSAASGARI